MREAAGDVPGGFGGLRGVLRQVTRDGVVGERARLVGVAHGQLHLAGVDGAVSPVQEPAVGLVRVPRGAVRRGFGSLPNPLFQHTGVDARLGRHDGGRGGWVVTVG